MLSTILPIVLAAQASGCPSPDDATGRFRIRNGERSCVEIAKDEIAPRAITAAEKRRIIDHFDLLLVDGPSARWRWGQVVRGHVACFRVNSKNRMGGYAGWSRYTFDLETGKESDLDKLDALLERLEMPERTDICD